MEDLIRGCDRSVDQLDATTGELIRKFQSHTEAAHVLSIKRIDISQCCKEIRKTAGGFNWRYSNVKSKQNEQEEGRKYPRGITKLSTTISHEPDNEISLLLATNKNLIKLVITNRSREEDEQNETIVIVKKSKSLLNVRNEYAKSIGVESDTLILSIHGRRVENTSLSTSLSDLGIQSGGDIFVWQK